MNRGTAGDPRRQSVSEFPSFESQFDPIELVFSRIPFVDPFSYDDRQFHASLRMEHVQALSSNVSEPSMFDSRGPLSAPLGSREFQLTGTIELDVRMSLQRTPSLPPAGPAQTPATVTERASVSLSEVIPNQKSSSMTYLSMLTSPEFQGPNQVPQHTTHERVPCMIRANHPVAAPPIRRTSSQGSSSTGKSRRSFIPPLRRTNSDSSLSSGRTNVMLTAIALRSDTHFRDVVIDQSRLTPDQAVRIFKQRQNKTAKTASLLSAEYGVSPKAIRDIWTRKSWVHDTRPYWTLLDEQLYDQSDPSAHLQCKDPGLVQTPGV